MSISGIDNSSLRPSFGQVKSIQYRGLYGKDKYAEEGRLLSDAFKQNPDAMAFCNKYDTDIVFYADKGLQDSVESSVHIFFDNVAKSKLARFFQKLNGQHDEITISAYGNEYNVADSLKSATKNLIDYILPKNSESTLGSHIKLKEEKIQEVLNAKQEKQAAKASKAKLKAEAKEKQKTDKQLLEESKQSLMDAINNPKKND